MTVRRTTGTPSVAAIFGPDFFPFLRGLAKNNDRQWFEANKSRYRDHVQAPALEFVRRVGPQLERISPHLIADPRPVGGSVMRIYRDIRFSKDKSPYKTAVGIRFMVVPSGADDAYAPGFFLRLAPGDSWTYAGIWQIQGPALDHVRKAIVDRTEEWRKVRAAVPEVEGESLRRAPTGFDPAHPFIEDIKRKGFSAGLEVKDSEVTRPEFPDRFVAACRTLDPLNRFLSSALGVEY